MPTYEFTCPQGHDFEKFYRTISAGAVEVACPVCGEVAERRVSGGAGLLFKGSGFYITDYGKDGKKDQSKPADAGSKPAADGAKADSGGKSDSASGPSSSSPAPKATE